MSENLVLSRFAKCGGDLHYLSRKFHNLDKEQRRLAVGMIADGIDPKKAINRAKRIKMVAELTICAA